MLISATALGERRRLAAGALAPLAESLTADLLRLVQTPNIYVPATKARLSRAGGRCTKCGAMLAFDPWSPHTHRCTACAAEYSGADHDGMWVMWYQLWLAERAVHAAALFATRGEPAHRDLAERILVAYAERYLTYPNRDNVLGPTRVFFSTYLESIWTLQLAFALDILESTQATALGATLRDSIIQPSAALIAQYDEGLSNRQVWNNAALLAAALLLGNSSLAERAVAGRSGLLLHLERALFSDGTWYEGENYHLFAHRGLWYGITLADAAGFSIPAELRRRYRRAFETPFLTALPDFTFPSRRDSQYKVSLRQWRIAESCELGLAQGQSDVLRVAMRELYRSDVAAGPTGRDRSTAEAERNVPASRLTRADLGWKALLFATEASGEADSATAPLGSVLLPDQGYAVLRRDNGRTYVALDYGESGGGHGHPDRLNLWLVAGGARILEDVGTGSYVDPSLHWYRSTLAHNAPLPMAQSQQRTDGELVAYDERGDYGWVLASAVLAPNVDAERAVVAGPNYLVDELVWSGSQGNGIDLPFHIAGQAPSVHSWTDAILTGADGLEDGFGHILGAQKSHPLKSATIESCLEGVDVRLWLAGDDPFVLWRVRGPGPPNEPARDFFVTRFAGVPTGRIRTVIDWTGMVASVHATEDALVVTQTDGSRQNHARREDEWHITSAAHPAIVLSGRTVANKPPPTVQPLGASRPAVPLPRVSSVDPTPGVLARADTAAARFHLGAEHYRRSEESWEEAGRPSATVALALSGDDLHLDFAVEKSPLAFAPARSENPLDNEHPDINSDGIQLYFDSWSWLLVPENEAPNVRVTAREGANSLPPDVHAAWRPTPEGFSVHIIVSLSEFKDRSPGFLIDAIVNEMPPGRERRRGQLVLSGGRGEWIYLRGDRQPHSRFLHLQVPDA